MPTKDWIRFHYRDQPKDLQEMLCNEYQCEDISVLLRYVRKYPISYTLHARIADYYWDAGRKRIAIKKWFETVKLFPMIANPYFQRAHWAINTRNFVDTAKYLELCLRFDNGYFKETAHFWRAESLFQIGSYSAAKRELENVRDDFQEMYFLDYKQRSKADILNDINSAKPNNA